MQLRSPILKKLFSFLFASIFICSFAQDGTNVYPFLNIPFSARQAALGGDVVSIRDEDVSFSGVNPALMHLDQDKMLSINYASYLAGSQYGTFSYVKDIKRGSLISVSAKYMDYGSMPRTDESGNTSGNFNAMDAAIGLAYAYQFEDEWTIGGKIDFVTSKIDNYTSMAVAGTAGVTYHFDQTNETLALVVRNFGYQIKPYNGVREQLPLRIDLGYTKILDEFPLAMSVTLHDLQKFNISQETNNNGQKVGFGRKVLDHLSLGAEIFPGQAFNFRLGYNIKRGNELAVVDQRSFAGLSVGFGLKISYFKFDYAHVRYHSASNVNMFGITVDLVDMAGNSR